MIIKEMIICVDFNGKISTIIYWNICINCNYWNN